MHYRNDLSGAFRKGREVRRLNWCGGGQCQNSPRDGLVLKIVRPGRQPRNGVNQAKAALPEL
jgi:hypothetical protein